MSDRSDLLPGMRALLERIERASQVPFHQQTAQQARAAYERAIAADPALADAECNLGILLDLYLDDPAAALPHYERYQALAGDADKRAAAWLAELRTRLGLVQRTAEVQP